MLSSEVILEDVLLVHVHIEADVRMINGLLLIILTGIIGNFVAGLFI